MNKFLLAVFTKPNELTVEELMRNYDKSLRVDKYIKYLKHDAILTVREDLENYKNSIYADYVQNPSEYLEIYGEDTEHINFLENIFPKMLEWTDEECYESLLASYSPEMVDEEGNLYSDKNPNAKWSEYKYVSSLQVKDMMFNSDEELYSNAIRFWEVFIEGAEPEDDEVFEETILDPQYYIEKYGNKEDYATIKSNWSTTAVLTPDGVWHEYDVKDRSGESEMEWKANYANNFINSADPEWTLTLIEYHI